MSTRVTMHHILLYLCLKIQPSVWNASVVGSYGYAKQWIALVLTESVCTQEIASLCAQFIARVSTLHSGTSTKPEFWCGYLKKGFGHISAQWSPYLGTVLATNCKHGFT